MRPGRHSSLRVRNTAFFAILLCACALRAEEPKPEPLWPGGAPGAKGTETGDKRNPGDVPTITVYRAGADKATGAAVVICPGGGYAMLAAQHEGVEVAEWLNSLGVTCVLLRYRLGPRYQHPAPLQDAQRAIRTVRARANEWEIDPNRVGILGFSAGGHLASTAATHFDRGSPGATDPIERESARPDFAILIYPVIALGTEYGHKGSLRNLLGENPSETQIRELSNEQQVTKDTPPCFLAHTNEDSAVPPENSLLLALALRRAGVPLELHVIEKGPHGLGLGTGSQEHRVPPSASFQVWPGLCATWMKERGYLKQLGSP